MQWDVLPAVEADAESVAMINAAGWRSAYRGIIPDVTIDSLDVAEMAEAYRAVVAAPFPTALFVVRRDESGADIAGFCGVCPVRDSQALDTTGELAAIYVDPSATGSGAGSALHDAALTHLTRAPFDDAVLWVFEANRSARLFYERRGWEYEDSRRYYEAAGRDVPMVRYRRRLC